MKQLLDVPLEDGTSVVVMVEAPASKGPGMDRTPETLQAAMVNMNKTAGVLISALKELTPQEITLEFGVTLNWETGKLLALIGDAKAEGSMKVTMNWKPALK